METTYVNETYLCQHLPGLEIGWSVENLGEDKWRVYQGGSSWDLEKLDGASAGISNVVRVSGFVFAIVAYQEC